MILMMIVIVVVVVVIVMMMMIMMLIILIIRYTIGLCVVIKIVIISNNDSIEIDHVVV